MYVLSGPCHRIDNPRSLIRIYFFPWCIATATTAGITHVVRHFNFSFVIIVNLLTRYNPYRVKFSQKQS